MHQQNLFNPIDDQKNNDQFKNWCKDLIAETLSNKFKLEFLILILNFSILDINEIFF